ncbi:MoaD/ThiS family protein [Candidatus Saccharibacteria bacterium]|nr:MoaD/ThiS family protein [Candidatus Saccharibacteria bacterium]
MAKDLMGGHQVSLKIDGDSVYPEELKQILITKYPRLQEASNFMIAVNKEYSMNEAKIKDSDEVAIIPPTNGG